jgi:hypothetical protein
MNVQAVNARRRVLQIQLEQDAMWRLLEKRLADAATLWIHQIRARRCCWSTTCRASGRLSLCSWGAPYDECDAEYQGQLFHGPPR